MMDSTRPTWTNTQQIIAYALVFSFIGVIFVWMLMPPKVVDQAALTVVNMLLGALVAKFTTIIDFFFGSSQGSKAKDESQSRTIENLTASGATNSNIAAAAVAAAEIAAPPAAAEAAPPAAAVAAPPAAEAAAPAAAETAVAEALARSDMDHDHRVPHPERKPE
jgi:predicted lipid-binding transport protein (Tim44 family)